VRNLARTWAEDLKGTGIRVNVLSPGPTATELAKEALGEEGQKALPLMGPGGSIILTGSSAGTTGAPGFTAYSASKAAVRNLARTWAEDLKGTGIRVNVLSPGATATELAKEALGEEGQRAYGAMTPLQRMADPAEIGAVAAFLASADSSFMTASEVAVDGGLAQI
jgi:NAD(P)-dependent dehydrogenase (short-subunit alcohol dehydrogenase family)